MTTNYGTVQHGNVQITLTQNAWLHHDGQYRASGLGDDGLDYTVFWATTEAWDAANAEAAANRANGDYTSYPALLDDESNACDWDALSDIRLDSTI